MAPVTTAITPANADGIELRYETFGDPAAPSILLVMGLGAQMVAWPEEFCEMLVDAGYHAIRYDNRDVGESTWVHTPDFDAGATLMGLLAGQSVEVPYLIDDLAEDAVSLLDHLDIASAHVVGASMGGMIAQALAIAHPDRVRSLTSIMSTSGEAHVGQPTPEILGALLTPGSTDLQEAIEAGVEIQRVISSPDHFDEAEARARSERQASRGINPEGVARQLVGIVASGSRAEGLAQLDVPTLVVHGRQDPLVTFSGGERTAELIPGAEFLVIDDMAHDVPVAHHPRITAAITDLAARADADFEVGAAAG